MERFESTVCLVTGATRGLGRGIAERLLEEGAIVYGVGRSEDLGTELESQSGRFRFCAADVSAPDQMTDVVDRILHAEGKLDHLVCNAGITRDQLLLRMSDAQWDDVLRVNLTGAFYGIRAALRPLMKSGHGSIVAISSLVGQTGNAGQANYAASKAGLIALCQSAAKEVARKRVRVNVVAPGLIDSEMTASLPAALRAAYVDRIPLQRVGTAQEVAAAVCFLLSAEASYITGQVLAVNGGLYP